MKQRSKWLFLCLNRVRRGSEFTLPFGHTWVWTLNWGWICQLFAPAGSRGSKQNSWGKIFWECVWTYWIWDGFQLSGEVNDAGSIPDSGRSPGGRHGNPLQYFCLENPMDRGAWRATVDRVAKSQTLVKWLSTHLVIRAICDSHTQKRS